MFRSGLQKKGLSPFLLPVWTKQRDIEWMLANRGTSSSQNYFFEHGGVFGSREGHFYKSKNAFQTPNLVQYRNIWSNDNCDTKHHDRGMGRIGLRFFLVEIESYAHKLT